MNLASHSSMSYLPPRHWWMRPFRFIARCQSKPIEEQIKKYGIRCFDIRITFDKDGLPCFAHGAMTYKGNVRRVLRRLNYVKGGVKVRLILETTFFNKYSELNEKLFRWSCEVFEKEYPNIYFFEGRRKSDWKLIYDFGNPAPSYEQKISSMTWKKLDDWWPWLYARIMNRKNIKRGTDKDYLFIDFINIQ